MVLRLLAAAAEHWLGNRLNDYLRDPDEMPSQRARSSPAGSSTELMFSVSRPVARVAVS